MSDAENDFFDILIGTVGVRYYVFPQVHLSAILDHRIKGQSWKFAFRSINGKSVDFVLCDKVSRKPLVAIELDDYTHKFEDRKQRDALVEKMLSDARLPLLRITNYNTMNEVEVERLITTALSTYSDN